MAAAVARGRAALAAAENTADDTAAACGPDTLVQQTRAAAAVLAELVREHRALAKHTDGTRLANRFFDFTH